MGGARTRSRGKSGSGPFLRIAPQRSSVQAHLPTSIGTKRKPSEKRAERRAARLTDLIVESATRFEEIEEGRVCGTAPEVKIGDLKVAPDCVA